MNLSRFRRGAIGWIGIFDGTDGEKQGCWRALPKQIVAAAVLALASRPPPRFESSDSKGPPRAPWARRAPRSTWALPTWAVPFETQGWNPHDSKWAQPGALVGSSVLEPLATIGPTSRPSPGSPPFTPNATYDSWTLTLRPGVLFHDGEKFDAASVKANIDDAATAPPVRAMAMKGMFEQVTVVDDLTVRVDLTQPWAAFPTSFLNGQSAMQMAPDTLSASDRGQTHPVGTGPFAFASWTPDGEFRTVKNVCYWRAGEPHLDALTFRVIADSASAAAALSTGDVNLLFTSSPQVANQAASTDTVLKNWTTEPGVAITNTAATVVRQAQPAGQPPRPPGPRLRHRPPGAGPPPERAW